MTPKFAIIASAAFARQLLARAKKQTTDAEEAKTCEEMAQAFQAFVKRFKASSKNL